MGPDSWTRCRLTREIPFGFAQGRLCLRLKSGSDQDGAHRALYGDRISGAVKWLIVIILFYG